MKAKQGSKIDEVSVPVRRRKVSTVRRQLRQGKYDTNSRMAAILDKVLEDLAT